MLTFFKDYIEAQTNLVFGTDLFISKDPDSPDSMVRLSNESGFREPYMNAYASDWLGFMVRFRGYMPEVEARAFEVHNLLTGYGQVLTDDFFLVATWCQGEPQQVEIDDKGRTIMSAHYLAHVNWITSTARKNLQPVI